MTPARARRASHLKLVVDNPAKEPSNMPIMLFLQLPTIFATSLYEGWVAAWFGPRPEKH